MKKKLANSLLKELEMTSKVFFCIVLIMVFFTTGCASTVLSPIQMPDPEPSGWQYAAPETQGMDSELLAEMLEDISAHQTNIYSVLVIRNGQMVTEAYFHPYTRETKMHIQSVTKSVIGMLVGKAIGDGTIQSVDTMLLDYYPNNFYLNPSEEKEAIRLKHLLAMASGLDCQEFTGSGPVMEQSAAWVQFMLNLPMAAAPGEVFGYCNGNAHLLSSILSKTTGLSAREYANQELFHPLGIPAVEEADWGSDPQGITFGGYGLYLRPIDLAKLAQLYLDQGQWEGQQVIPAQWVLDSTKATIQKEDGSGYGYLWTVYPGDDHYAALGLGGQQIHLFPGKNLAVIVTASLESYAEAPEIEKLLADYILPAVQSDAPLAANPEGYSRLQTAVERAANPVEPVAPLPDTTRAISNQTYTFGENMFGWQKLRFVFKPKSDTAQLLLNDFPALEIGMDNLYRLSHSDVLGDLLLRGHWENEATFVIDYPYPWGGTTLGEIGKVEYRLIFSGDSLDVKVSQTVFGGDPVTFTGTK
jgi:CubicO group peptidase (beta-lactamase class C family)